MALCVRVARPVNIKFTETVINLDDVIRNFRHATCVERLCISLESKLSLETHRLDLKTNHYIMFLRITN